MKLSEAVYRTLMDELLKEQCVPGVESMFREGSKCDLLYQEMRRAYDRLLARLGLCEDDADIETIICSLTAVHELVALRMFEIGTLIGAAYPYLDF